MANFEELFNMDAEDFVEKASESTMYRVSPKGGKNGVYSALIRFVPWHKDPKNSMLTKWEAWLENPLTKKGMNVDCPSSIGKPSELKDLYWKMKNSGNPELEKKASLFSRKPKYYALVQILKDENNPELEGKIKVWKFGQKIYDKIQAELKPEFGSPHVPFDPFTGRAFHIKCKQVGEWPNYDESKFLEQHAPIIINGEFASKENPQALLNFLQEASPDLDQFKAKEWSHEQENHFREMVKVVVPSMASSVESLSKQESIGDFVPSTSEGLQTETPKPEPKNGPVNTSGQMNFEFNV